MRRPAIIMRGAAWLLCALVVLPGCRKPTEAVKSDLGEAGYQLAAPDLLRAAAGDDVPALRKFAASGFPMDSKDAAGDSALHSAAATGAQNAADFLLDRGVALDSIGATSRTPLMAAVAADQPAMVRWLLRQGADPRIKDADGYTALMLGVRNGRASAVAELAPYQRENLDSALLLAALEGRTDVIDTLTNYGASVYARMEDGRTPLMLAAENGHEEAVELLLDIGAGRFTTNAAGQTATDLALAAGHAEIANLLSREELPDAISLESPDEIARSMDTLVDTALAKASVNDPGGTIKTPNGSETVPSQNAAGPAAAEPRGPDSTPQPSRPIAGEVLSAAVPVSATTHANEGQPQPATPDLTSAAADSPQRIPSAEAMAMPPLVMRHYQERQLPLEVRTVEDDTATLAIRSGNAPEVRVRPGEHIPGSRLTVIRVERRLRDSKDQQGAPSEVSVVEVRDDDSGNTREWISGIPASAHDPVAMVEDAATGKRYIAKTGERFRSADGREFIISDVRPNQLVIEDASSGAVTTIPLIGPRG